MKTSSDPRHRHRRKQVQLLFAHAFDSRQNPPGISSLTDSFPILDDYIAKAAPEWPLAKINHIDLAILRLACFELLVEKKEPLKVIIDEAVELAKEFGAEGSPAFINGALGAIVKYFPADSNTETVTP